MADDGKLRDLQEELAGLLETLRELTGDPTMDFGSPDYEEKVRALEAGDEASRRLAGQIRELEKAYEQTKREIERNWAPVVKELTARERAANFLARLFAQEDPRRPGKMHPNPKRLAVFAVVVLSLAGLIWVFAPEYQRYKQRKEQARLERLAKLEEARRQAMAQQQAGAPAGEEAPGGDRPPELPPELPDQGQAQAEAGQENGGEQAGAGDAGTVVEAMPPAEAVSPQSPPPPPDYYAPPPGYGDTGYAPAGPADLPPGAEEAMRPRRILVQSDGKITASRVTAPASGEENPYPFRGAPGVVRPGSEARPQAQPQPAQPRVLVSSSSKAGLLVSSKKPAGEEGASLGRGGAMLVRPAAYKGTAQVAYRAQGDPKLGPAVLVRDGRVVAPAKKRGTEPEDRQGLAGLATAGDLPYRPSGNALAQGTQGQSGGGLADLFGAKAPRETYPPATATATGGGNAPVDGAATRPVTSAYERGAASPWSPGDVVKAKIEVGVVMHEGMTEAPVVAKAEDGTTFFGRAQLRADKRMAITFHSAFRGNTAYQVNAIARDPGGDFGLSARVEEIAPALFTDLVRGALTGVTKYIDAYTQSVQSTVTQDGTVVQERPVPPLDITVLSGVANLFKVPEDQRALIRVFRLPKGTELEIVFLPPEEPVKTGQNQGGLFGTP